MSANRVRCGNAVHKSFHFSLADEVHHHESVAQVRLCFARKDEFGLRSLEELALEERWEDEARAEYEAERAAERYWEDRGWQEALAQDEYEARMGVVPFDVAYANAMRSL